jgi:hypothetical protein
MNALTNAFEPPPETQDDPGALLEIGPSGGWFRVDGLLVDIARRKPVARLLLALAEGARDRPGCGISSASLIAYAWPGERIVHHAAQIRVRVGIATLRASGLARRIVTTRAGYMLVGPVRLEAAGATEASDASESEPSEPFATSEASEPSDESEARESGARERLESEVRELRPQGLSLADAERLLTLP